MLKIDSKNKIITTQAAENNTISDLSNSQQNNSSSGFLKDNMTIASNKNWPSAESNAYLDHEKTLAQIDQYVRSFLFHQLKFISAPEMIAFSKDKRSLCQLFCDKLKVKENEQLQFWSLYTKTINQKLNKKHLEVSNALCKAFKGKFFENKWCIF